MYSVLKTEHLTLRPLNITDLNTAYEYSSDIEATKYMYFLPHDSVEETIQFLNKVSLEWQKESPDFYEFAVMLGDQHIGAVSVYLNDNHSEGELGWIIKSDYYGNGYATEAAAAIRDFSKNKLNLKKLTAHCDKRNIASYKVMKKIGMILEYDDGVRIYPKTHEQAQELSCYLLCP